MLTRSLLYTFKMNFCSFPYPPGFVGSRPIGPMDLSLGSVPHHEEENIVAELENVDLWKQFDENATEMVITKAGRSVNP